MKHLYLKKIEIDNENLSPTPPPLPYREGNDVGQFPLPLWKRVRVSGIVR
jgi:hypothetical protein